jgi:DNA-binding IclR family transcriptional regulator
VACEAQEIDPFHAGAVFIAALRGTPLRIPPLHSRMEVCSHLDFGSTQERVDMSGSLDRGLAIIELLAKNGRPLPLRDIAERLNIPPSATHRLLALLSELGYVRQAEDHGDYQVSMKLISLGLITLSASGITHLAQPVLDDLAQQTGELARLGLIEDERMVFVAKAQGARYGVRYDPDMGKDAKLFCTACGHAWLMGLSDEEALTIVSRQGFGRAEEHGPNAPRTIPAFLNELQAARKRGYGLNIDSSMLGIGAVAVPVPHPVTGRAVGSVILAVPSSRMNPERVKEFVPLLQQAAMDLSGIALVPGSLLNKAVNGESVPDKNVSRSGPEIRGPGKLKPPISPPG